MFTLAILMTLGSIGTCVVFTWAAARCSSMTIERAAPALNRGLGTFAVVGSRGTLRRWRTTSRSGTSRRVLRGKRRPNPVGQTMTLAVGRAKTVPLEVC
jgi:hypothetical protein